MSEELGPVRAAFDAFVAQIKASLASKMPASARGEDDGVCELINGQVPSNRLPGVVSPEDPRLTDAREWIAQTISQTEAEAGTATEPRKWTAQRVRQAIVAWWSASTDKTKLDGIQAGATANDTNAQLRDRSTHTGTQAISTIANLSTELAAKLNASGYTAADVLAKLKTVDGAGSGLDADTLDGMQLATIIADLQAYTQQKIAELVDSSPAALDTLNELAAALGDDPNFATTINNALASKLDSSAFTAAAVLALLKTVDGSGSGLDADTLDGLNSSAFATAAQGAKADTAVQPAALGTSASRNVAASGNAAATEVVLGSDTRLSNSREWIATEVSQIEAEAGTSTTARKWTAQRVRQAVEAWWNGSSYKTKLDGIQEGAQVNTVTSVAGKTGAVSLNKADVGLGSVDNTADVDKPVSTATQAALDGKLATGANAASATKLQTARTINGVAFDGTANITVVDATKEPAIAAGTTAQYRRGDKTWQDLPAAVRSVAMTGLSTATNAVVTVTDTLLTAVGKLQAQITGLASSKLDANANAVSATKLATARTIGGVAFDGSANINLPGVNAPGNQNTSGSAATLATGRTIAMTGDVSWTSPAFNGSSNVTAAATLANTGVAAGTYGKVTVDVKGRVTAGAALAATDIPALPVSKITDLQSSLDAKLNVADLSSSVSSNSASTAATSSAVKQAYDLANAALPASQKGANNGVASLDANGKVPSAQLPSYVDDVLEFAALANFPATGESSKIYIAIDSGKIYRWTGSVYVNIGANASTADAAVKLSTARTIGITGDATWSISFDGSANVSGSLTLSNSGVVAGTYPKVTVDAKGRVTAGAALTAADIPNLDAGKITTGVFAAARIPTLNQNTTGNAGTATKLQTARTINGVAFDGTANITVADATKLPLAGGAMTGDLVYQNVGVGGWARGLTAKIQSSGAYAAGIGFYGNGDTLLAAYLGVGASPWSSGNGVRVTAAGVTISGATTFDTLIAGSVNGNAATATKLATARTIGGVAFDGTANINLPGVNTAGNQNTTGTAASAAKWTTSRSLTITGDASWTISIDGTANASAALTLANTGVAAGSYGKVTVDAKGRVTAGTALSVADIPALPISKTSGLQATLDGKSDKPYVIAVVGDSIGMETTMYGDSWCTKLERYLNAYPGRQVVVRNFSIGGLAFKSATTEAFFGTKTTAQAVVACAPDMVITMLGANDALTIRRFGGVPESLSALKGYADTYFNYLRTSLPSARLILAKEIMYDRTHANLASLKNREVIPFFWNTVTNNAYPEHWLLNAAYRESHGVDPSHFPDFVMLNDLYTYIAGKAYLTAAVDMDYYRMARIGGMGADNLHPNEFGKMVVAAYIKTGILSLALPEFADKTDFGTVPHLMNWDNADSLFGLLVESDGTKWVNRTVVEGDLFDLMEGAPGRWNLPLWMLPYRASFNFDSYECGVGDTVHLSISNAKKRTPVYGSVNDSGWSASPLTTTDGNGCAFISYTPTTPGVKTLYYRSDYYVYGPFSINVSATSEPLDGGAY